MFEPEIFARQLRAAGVEGVSVEPSGICGSPYDHVYVYLTSRGPEGSHLIISAGEEYGEKGVLCGTYTHYEEPGAIEEFEGYTGALKWVTERVFS